MCVIRRGRQNHLIRTDGLKCCDGTRRVRRVGAGGSDLNIGVKTCETRSSRGDKAQPWVSEWENGESIVVQWADKECRGQPDSFYLGEAFVKLSLKDPFMS